MLNSQSRSPKIVFPYGTDLDGSKPWNIRDVVVYCPKLKRMSNAMYTDHGNAAMLKLRLVTEHDDNAHQKLKDVYVEAARALPNVLNRTRVLPGEERGRNIVRIEVSFEPNHAVCFIVDIILMRARLFVINTVGRYFEL